MERAAKMIVVVKGFVTMNWVNVGAFMDILVSNFFILFYLFIYFIFSVFVSVH